MSGQEFTLWLLIAFAGTLLILLLAVLHERETRRIEREDDVYGDWPSVGGRHE